jgi:hypothetical protein
MPDERTTARRIVVQAFTIETSFGEAGGVLSDDAIWRQIGAKVAKWLFHLFGDTHAELTRDASLFTESAEGRASREEAGGDTWKGGCRSGHPRKGSDIA